MKFLRKSVDRIERDRRHHERENMENVKVIERRDYPASDPYKALDQIADAGGVAIAVVWIDTKNHINVREVGLDAEAMQAIGESFIAIARRKRQ